MKWAEIIAQVRDRLQEQSEAFFSDDRLMDSARRVQAEIAAATECIETMDEMDVSAGCIECPLPEDCLNIISATFDGRPLMQVDTRRLDYKVYPSGTPSMYYIFGSNIGLYPSVSAVKKLKLWYSQRPPLGAFSLSHSGAGGASAATIAVTGGSITMTVTGGTYTGTDSIDTTATGTNTIGGVSAAINALGKGWTALKQPGCRAVEPAPGIEETVAKSAFQKQLTVDLAVKLPEEFQQLIELGVIYRAMWKDTEFEAGEVYKREYLERLNAMRRVFWRRRTRSQNRTVRDAYGAGAAAHEAGIRVYIP